MYKTVTFSPLRNQEFHGVHIFSKPKFLKSGLLYVLIFQKIRFSNTRTCGQAKICPLFWHLPFDIGPQIMAFFDRKSRSRMQTPTCGK